MKPITYRHEDGRTIEIYPDRKVRRYPMPEGLEDQWKTLYRSTVPNLTDDEWYAKPDENWRLVQ